MGDWAAKVLAGVPRYTFLSDYGHLEQFIEEADAIAAIARMGAGDGLAEQATAALEGVTEGEWGTHHHDNYSEVAAYQPTFNSVCDVHMAADANFIAFTRQWVPEAAAHIAALTAERDEALESVTNNNEWFGMHSTLWMWLITQPDMPQLDDLEDGGADEVARNYERAITALVDARTDALRAKVARLEGAGDFARLIGNDAGKDDKDTVLVSYGMLRRLRAALTDGGKDG